AIDIELVGRRLVSKLEAVRLEYRVIAEFSVEPSQLSKEQAVAETQIVFEITEVIIAAEPAAQDLVAFETEMRRLAIGTDVIERATLEVLHQVTVACRE